MKKLIFLILSLIAVSCVTQKRCNEKFPPSQSERVVKETVTIYRDTTIFVHIKADTVHDTIRVYIGINGLVQSAVSSQHTQYAWSKAYVKDSKLYHETGQFEAEIAKTIRDAIMKTTQSTSKETIEVPKPVVTNILTGWQWFQIWTGRISLLLILLTIVFMVIRFSLRRFITDQVINAKKK